MVLTTARLSELLAFCYELYATLLRPAEANWKPAQNLIIITNGALGLLPLSLLPTAPAEINLEDDPLFSSYRKVPWLARSHAVTMVPSISALLTLRKLPLAATSRQELIGFVVNAVAMAALCQYPTFSRGPLLTYPRHQS